MNIKSLSFCQVHWAAQKLSQYSFYINYQSEKIGTATDTLSRFFQRNQAEKKTLKDVNIQIFYQLQTSLTRINIVGFNLSSLEKTKKSLLLVYQVFVCGTYIIPRLCQF